MTSWQSLLAAAAASHSTELANKSAIFDDALRSSLAAVQDGLIVVPPDEELRVDWMLSQLRGALEKSTRQIKMNLLQNHLDLGTDFDIAVQVCGPLVISEITGVPPTSGRVVLLGNLREMDVRLMLAELVSNEKKQRRARRHLTPLYEELAANLSPYGDYRSWRSGSR